MVSVQTHIAYNSVYKDFDVVYLLFCLEVLWRAWIEWFIAYFIIDPLIISQDDEMFRITIDSWFSSFWKSSN